MSHGSEQSRPAVGAPTKSVAALAGNEQEQESGGSAKKPPRAEVVADRFKTKLCTKWLETGRCPYDSRCTFAHGENELRTTALNRRDCLTTEQSIWRFMKTSIRGAGNRSNRSQSSNDRRPHPAAKPMPATAQVGASSLHRGGHHLPRHVSSLVPVTSHYMPYLTREPSPHLVHAVGASLQQAVASLFFLLPPAHSPAYASAPRSPVVYLVDPGTTVFFSAFGVGVSHRVGE